MWEDILKVQELQGVTSVLPKIESQEESDGPCKRKLQEIYDFWDEYDKDQKRLEYLMKDMSYEDLEKLDNDIKLSEGGAK